MLLGCDFAAGIYPSLGSNSRLACAGGPGSRQNVPVVGSNPVGAPGYCLDGQGSVISMLLMTVRFCHSGTPLKTSLINFPFRTTGEGKHCLVSSLSTGRSIVSDDKTTKSSFKEIIRPFVLKETYLFYYLMDAG